MLDNQGVQAFDEAVKYFPSAQLQYRGGGEMGRPQTRGFSRQRRRKRTLGRILCGFDDGNSDDDV